jgi:hypothetical protein
MAWTQVSTAEEDLLVPASEAVAGVVVVVAGDGDFSLYCRM